MDNTPLELLEKLKKSHYVDGRIPLIDSCRFEIIEKALKEHEGYAWRIDNLVTFDKPKEISEFKRKEIVIEYDADIDFEDRIEKLTPLTRAPLNYCYCEV